MLDDTAPLLFRAEGDTEKEDGMTFNYYKSDLYAEGFFISIYKGLSRAVKGPFRQAHAA